MCHKTYEHIRSIVAAFSRRYSVGRKTNQGARTQRIRAFEMQVTKTLLLSDAVGALQRAIFAYTFQTGLEHMELTIREHHDLFDAIRRKNPEKAEEASRRMVTRTAKRALHALDGARKPPNQHARFVQPVSKQ